MAKDQDLTVKGPLILTELPQREISAADLEAGEVFSGFELHRGFLAGIRVDALSFQRLRIIKSSLAESELKLARFQDSELSHCDLSNALCLESTFERVVIDNCRMTGAQLMECSIKDVIFRECKLELACLRSCELQSVRFESCDLKGADFSGSQLRNVAFQECDLGNAIFEKCQLNGSVDLRSSNVIGLQKLAGLEGATIDALQAIDLAPLMASSLGLRIRGD